MPLSNSISRREFLGAAGATLLSVSAAHGTSAASLGAPAKKILHVRSARGDAPQPISNALATRLAQAGYDVVGLTYDELLRIDDVSALSASAIIVLDAPRLPIEAGNKLVAFAGQGGHLVILGGHASADPLQRVDGSWITGDQWEQKLRSSPVLSTLLPVPANRPGAWTRCVSDPAGQSSVALDQGPHGACYHFALRHIRPYKWDLYRKDFAAAAPVGSNVIRFRAKSDSVTPDCLIQLNTSSNETWTRTLRLNLDWSEYVLSETSLEQGKPQNSRFSLPAR